MFSRIFVAASLTVLSLPAYCQSPPASSPATPPARVFYDQFMFRVNWLQTQANNLKAQGKDDSFMRSYMQRSAGLTTQQAASLNAIAADCQAQTQALVGQIKALAGTAMTSAISQQVQSLLSQRQQAVIDHMSQLQTAFGAAQYAALDSFVHATVNFGGGSTPPPR